MQGTHLMSPDRHTRSLTALVTTLNEEELLAGCLESLSWCDEVLVVDSFSTDRTEAIARSFPNVRFVAHTYHGSAAQKNWAMDRIESEWILILDADERCTPELRDEILALLSANPEHNAYTLARKVFFLGKHIRFSGWQRDQVIRLVKRGAARYPNRRVHADMLVRGDAPRLRHRLEHLMVTDLDEFARRTTRYAWWGAAQLRREGHRSGILQFLGRGFWRFVRTYLLQLGILDGRYGLVFCALQAYGTFLKWAIVWSWSAPLNRTPPRLPSFDYDTATWRWVDEAPFAEASRRGEQKTTPLPEKVAPSQAMSHR